MSTHARDTQFQGFADALWEELKPDVTVLSLALGRGDEHEVSTSEQCIKGAIARRAYDFLEHAVYTTSFIATREECRERVKDVPDMTEFPKEQA